MKKKNVFVWVSLFLLFLTGVSGAATQTTVGEVAAISGKNYLSIRAAYSGDDEGQNNTLSVSYKKSVDADWTALPDLTHSASPYRTQITGLLENTKYDLKLTFNDANGVSGTNPVIISNVLTSTLMHNSLNLESTKWTGKWGTYQAGSKYGEFDCGTCHAPRATNIKGIKTPVAAPNSPVDSFPGSTVNFQSITGANGFGNDLGGHGTSEKICEVCHSQNKYHNYNTANNTVNGGNLTHNNNTDCISCHTHKAGFRASCDMCHGNPPIAGSFGGPTGLVNNPAPTGSTTPGAHAKHVTTMGLPCSYCHYNSVGSGATHMNTTVTIGFKNIFGTLSGGTYDGQAAANYDSTDAGTTVTKTGSKTCSSVYCHGGTMSPNGGTATAVWDTPASGACGTCHGATAASPPVRGSHEKHVSSAGYSFACTKCHPAVTDGTHVNANVAWSLDSTDTRIGAGARYNNLLSGNTGGAAPSGSYSQCSSLYCHSDGQATPNYKTPTWGATLDCKGCHNYTAASLTPMATGKHGKHVNNSAVIGDNFGCQECHNATTTNGTSITDKTKHVNKTRDISLAKGGSYNPDTGTCSTAYCHSSGKGVYTSPAWSDAAWATVCNKCHGTGNAKGYPDYANAGPNVANSNSHSKHAGDMNYSCSKCHTNTTIADGTAIKAVSVHTNQAINVDFGAGLGGTWTSGNKTCSNVYCHSDAKGAYASPVWGGSLGALCTGCHGFPPLTSAHAKHVQDGSLLTKAYGNTEVSSSAGNYSFGCGNCHPVTAAKHVDGTIDVSLNPADGGALKAKNDPAAASAGSGATTVCNKIYCHSNGAAGAGSNIATAASPQWGGSFGANKCGSCHGNPPQYASAGAGVAGANSHYNATGFMGKEGGHMITIHRDNIFNKVSGSGLITTGIGVDNSHGNATVATTMACYVCHSATASSATIDTYAMDGTESSFKCSVCHTAETTTKLQAGAISDKSKHVNGQPDVAFAGINMKSKAQLRTASLPSGWTRTGTYGVAGSYDSTSALLNTGTWTSESKTCTVACHLGQPAKWGDTTVTCYNCHNSL